VLIGGAFLLGCVGLVIYGAATKPPAVEESAPVAAAPSTAPARPAAPTPPPPVEPLPLIGAVQLARAYQDNEVAADVNWRGKRIRVAGIEQEISRVDDAPAVRLGAAETGVACLFGAGEDQEVMTLRRGGAAILEGTVRGPGPGTRLVVLERCSYPASSTIAPLYPDKLQIDRRGRVTPIGSLATEPGLRN